MPRSDQPRYVFRPVAAADLPMLAVWLDRPHVAEWWDDVEDKVAEIREAMGDPATQPFVVELDGRPIGYIQCYDPHLEEGHPYRDQPKGTLGIDQFIGEPELVGIGHGSRLIAVFVDGLFRQGAPRVIIDPDPTNARAIRAYEKAGFRSFDTRTSIYGATLMMARDAPESGYTFRPMTALDMPMARRWLETPEVQLWWGDADGQVSLLEEDLDDPRMTMWIVSRDGRPFGYIQDYDPLAWAMHHFGSLPPGSRGVDQFIGEPDMLDRGHGSAFIRAHVDSLFAQGAPVVGVDPDPENARAIRAYEKAGFIAQGEVLDWEGEPALLMLRHLDANVVVKSL